MRVEEPPQGVVDHLVQATEPAGIDQRLHLREKPDWHFGLQSRGFRFGGHGIARVSAAGMELAGGTFITRS